MNLDLIDDETLESLPDEPGLAFVLFERACRASLMQAIQQEDSSSVIETLRLDYMHDVVAAAQHFRIPGLSDFRLPATGNLPWEVFEDFNRRVRFFTTHHRLTAKAQRSRTSVELQGSHKDRIRTLIAHLREAVDKSEMPDWRKDRLRKAMLDFEKALDGRRLNFAQAMTFLALIGAGLHGVGESADGLGKLVHEITVAIGQSKELEDAVRKPLPKPAAKAPVYLIEKKDPDRPATTFTRSQLDDEIPF